MNHRNKPVAYMAHPFQTEYTGLSHTFYWHLWQEFWDWTWINPFDGDYEYQYLKHPENLEYAAALVEQDLQLINESDLLVVYLPDAVEDEACHGIGSSMEIFYARHVLGKPVYIVTPHDHAWIKGLGCRIYRDVFSLLKTLREDYP